MADYYNTWMKEIKKTFGKIQRMNNRLRKELLKMNTDCKTVDDVSLKFSPDYRKHLAGHNFINNKKYSAPLMYWKKVLTENLIVIDAGPCFTTENGDLIDWHGQEAFEAQTFLLKKSKENKVAAPETMIDILKLCKVDGFIVRLPNIQLPKVLYDQVKLAFNKADGFWQGRSIQGFVFEEDPAPFLEKLISGVKVNIKKEYQFFGTPPKLGDYLVKLADLSFEHTICEPSAGDGAIVKAILRLRPDQSVFCYEIMDKNRSKLKSIPQCVLIGEDFLQCQERTFDRIIANPPFTNHLDTIHIMKMYDCLKFGGRIVTVSSRRWQTAKDKKAIEFRDFIKRVSAMVEDVPAGAFKESGTNIESLIIIIDK